MTAQAQLAHGSLIYSFKWLVSLITRTAQGDAFTTTIRATIRTAIRTTIRTAVRTTYHQGYYQLQGSHTVTAMARLRRDSVCLIYHVSLEYITTLTLS